MSTPAPFQFYLRSHHAAWLRELAQRNDGNISRSLARLIQAARMRPDLRQTHPTKKERLNLNVQEHDEAILDDLARKWGVTRSIVVRRLIEEAAEGRLLIADETA